MSPTRADGKAPQAQLGSECGELSQQAENRLQPLDIILALDTTSSMVEEIEMTAANLNSFFRQLVEAGIDTRVVLISSAKGGQDQVPFVFVEGPCIEAPLGSGSCPDDSNAPQFVHIGEPVADWDILQKFVTLYPNYSQYLRQQSVKVFFAISDGDVDDNAFNLQPVHTADQFIEAIDQVGAQSGLLTGWRYAAIYSYTACGLGNAVGQVHADLVKSRQGVSGDLCLQDFGPIFEAFETQFVETATITCDWAIPPPPDGKTFDPSKTNVQSTVDGQQELLGQASGVDACGASDGWYYDDAAQPARVIVCPATCTRIRSAQDVKVDLLFGCETVVLL